MAIVLHSEVGRRYAVRQRASSAAIDLSDYREFVFRCALAVCGEPDGAEDISQEVMLTLLRSQRQLAEADNPLAWIRKVTVRAATRFLKRGRKTTELTETLHGAGFGPDQIAVYQVLSSLKPEQRALLGMALNQGLSYAEIAEALDIPEGTVGSRLHAAKQEFQRRWQS